MKLTILSYLSPACVFSLLLSAAPSHAYLLPEIKAAHYKYQSYKTVQILMVEKVYGPTEEGKARLAQLKEEKFQCKYIQRDIYRCSKNIVDPQEPEISLEVETNLPFQDFKISSPWASPRLENESSYLQEWSLNQSFRLGSGESYAPLRLLITQDLAKIFLGNPSKYTFLPIEPGTLHFPLSVSKTESAWRFTVYFVQASFVAQEP